MRLLVSPWMESFELFARSIRRSALLVSPFITREPLQRLISLLDMHSPPQIQILTNLAVDSLAQGSTDASAIAEFCHSIPTATLQHLPGLHAKVYVADDRLAIVTSANLTEQGLNHNYEYGIEITDTTLITMISEDLRAYGALGSEVSLLEIDQLAEISQDLHQLRTRVFRSARRTLRQEFERRLEAASEALRHLRAKPGESTSAIFSRTILYLLRKGSFSTKQLHPLIQQIHPDLCDDSIDRIIGGVHFGKRWKHMVRNAQQSLKKGGLIRYREGKWY